MKEFVFAGFGGQGVLLGGQILAQMAADYDLASTWMPSYGVSMRGGTANCVVHISDGDIYSPGLEDVDYLIALNLPSYEKFKNDVVKGGTIFFNADSVDTDLEETHPEGVKLIKIPAATLANMKADTRSTNAAALGILLKYDGSFTHEQALESIGRYFERTGKAKVGKLFTDTFELGYQWAEKNL